MVVSNLCKWVEAGGAYGDLNPKLFLSVAYFSGNKWASAVHLIRRMKCSDAEISCLVYDLSVGIGIFFKEWANSNLSMAGERVSRFSRECDERLCMMSMGRLE